MVLCTYTGTTGTHGYRTHIVSCEVNLPIHFIILYVVINNTISVHSLQGIACWQLCLCYSARITESYIYTTGLKNIIICAYRELNYGGTLHPWQTRSSLQPYIGVQEM